MATVTVPKEHASGLSRIMNLSPSQSEAVVQALEKATSRDDRILTQLVVAGVPTLPNKDAREIIQTLLSLYSARIGMDMKVDAFVTELISAAKHVQSKETQPVEVAQKTLRDLLSVRPLSMISKARGIHVSYERTFCSARVITELRPVFDADVREDPAGFVMAHILRLGYHRSGKHADVHIAMDKIDIDSLILALQRAKEKAVTMKVVADKAGLPILAE
jgi:hypothetical protein